MRVLPATQPHEPPRLLCGSVALWLRGLSILDLPASPRRWRSIPAVRRAEDRNVVTPTAGERAIDESPAGPLGGRRVELQRSLRANAQVKRAVAEEDHHVTPCGKVGRIGPEIDTVRPLGGPSGNKELDTCQADHTPRCNGR